MKKSILFLSLGLLLCTQLNAATQCFVAKEGSKILKREGDCQKRYTPQSSFKIALSLMGFDAGILKSEAQPEWPFKEGYDPFYNACKSAHNPRTWMRDSCVWYSQLLTQKLGMEKFQGYLDKFNYGNRDASGDKGKNNGLTHAWLSSSLKISPDEQANFMQKLVENKLPISAKSNELTKKIMFKEELPGGWKLYGKTGTGNLHGWFVGWIEKNGRSIVFASHITDDKKEEVYAGLRANYQARSQLWKVIDELGK